MAGLFALVQGAYIVGVAILVAGVLLKLFGNRIADRLFRTRTDCEDGVCRTEPLDGSNDRPIS